MEIPVVLDGHRQVPGAEVNVYGKRQREGRTRGERPPLGQRSPAGVCLAHRRVSFRSSGGLLPTIPWRRLCDWCGVPRTQGAMGSRICELA